MATAFSARGGQISYTWHTAPPLWSQSSGGPPSLGAVGDPFCPRWTGGHHARCVRHGRRAGQGRFHSTAAHLFSSRNGGAAAQVAPQMHTVRDEAAFGKHSRDGREALFSPLPTLRRWEVVAGCQLLLTGGARPVWTASRRNLQPGFVRAQLHKEAGTERSVSFPPILLRRRHPAGPRRQHCARARQETADWKAGAAHSHPDRRSTAPGLPIRAELLSIAERHWGGGGCLTSSATRHHDDSASCTAL